jgi:hypothetical protein
MQDDKTQVDGYYGDDDASDEDIDLSFLDEDKGDESTQEPKK